jgi:hypothetical protein
MAPLVIFLNYEVLDHMQRLDDGSYAGKNEKALKKLKKDAASGKYEIWMARITQVEMILGRENPNLDSEKREHINSKDSAKLRIAEEMGVRWLNYPCSGYDDSFSRWDVTFGYSDNSERWLSAKELEKRLDIIIPDDNKADSRQVVSLVYGFEVKELDDNILVPPETPKIGWLVTEDKDLRQALQEAIEAGRLNELAHIRIVCVPELVQEVLV